MIPNNRFFSHIPVRVFLGAIIALPATTKAAPSDDISEVIVTASKIDKAVNRLGMSVTVIGGDHLSTLNGAEDLTIYVPGLQAAVANGSQVAFQIRGIGAVDHQALTPTAAAVYIDGTYMATNVQTSPLLFDIEQVEVLKGPQGSLYGRNASSGAISFSSKLPDDTAEGYVGGEYGSFDRLNLKGAATLPISDTFSLRLAGRYLRENPILENVQTNPAIPAPINGSGKRDEIGIRASGRLAVSDQTEAIFILYYSEDNGINAAPVNDSLSLDKHQISVGPDGIQDSDNEFFGVSANVEHVSGDFSLISLTSFTGYNQQYGFDFDGTPAPFGVGSLNANLAYDRDFWQASQEFRLSYQGSNSDVMIGAYIGNEDFEQQYLIWCGQLDPVTKLGDCRYVGAPGRAGPDPASTGVATSLVSTIEQTRKTGALFTYNSFELSANLALNFGGRLTYEKITGRGKGEHYFDDGIIALNNRDGLGLAIGSNQIRETHFSGNLGLDYQLTDQAFMYLSFASGYKSGGFNGEVINNVTHFANEGLFAAETVNALETGLKYTGNNLTINMASFYQFYNNPQARIFVPFDTDGGGSFTSNSLSNLDKAKSWGVEADVGVSPTEGLSINVGFTFLDTEINQLENPAVPQNAEIFDGNPLPFASKISTTLSARYEWPLSQGMRAGVEANSKYQSAFYLDAEGRDDRRQTGYTVVDLTANVYFGNGTQIGLWVRNLTNANYAVSGFGFIGYNRFLAAPRSYGLSVKYSY